MIEIKKKLGDSVAIIDNARIITVTKNLKFDDLGNVNFDDNSSKIVICSNNEFIEHIIDAPISEVIESINQSKKR